MIADLKPYPAMTDSDLAGSLSSEVSFSITTLEAGTHTITFRVRDNDGA